MLRLESYPEGTPRFEAARRWRAWHELPGLVVLATGYALWIWLATGAPLGRAVARLDAADAAPALDRGPPPSEAVLAPGMEPCVCAVPVTGPRGG